MGATFIINPSGMFTNPEGKTIAYGAKMKGIAKKENIDVAVVLKLYEALVKDPKAVEKLKEYSKV